MVAGGLYGFVSPVLGHPLDTIKTKMQAEAKYQHMKMRHIIVDMWRADKVRGFYRGFTAPLIASSVYRSIQFSAYAATFSACEHVPQLAEPIPYTGGLRLSVLAGACAATLTRSVIESPFEFIKVRMQTNGPWLIEDGSIRSMMSTKMIVNVYNGYTPLLKRTFLLLGSFFIMIDYSVRYFPDFIDTPIVGPFFKVTFLSFQVFNLIIHPRPLMIQLTTLLSLFILNHRVVYVPRQHGSLPSLLKQLKMLCKPIRLGNIMGNHPCRYYGYFTNQMV
jgi:hypothetical protein